MKLHELYNQVIQAYPDAVVDDVRHSADYVRHRDFPLLDSSLQGIILNRWLTLVLAGDELRAITYRGHKWWRVISHSVSIPSGGNMYATPVHAVGEYLLLIAKAQAAAAQEPRDA